MPHETIEERRARLMPGARWLREQREKRGWTQGELAGRLGVIQERISAYERAQDQMPAATAAALAETLEMPEIEVWRCLHLPLPSQVQTDEEIIAWAWDRFPDAMSAATGRKPPVKGNGPGRKDATRPRSGENASDTSRGAETAI